MSVFLLYLAKNGFPADAGIEQEASVQVVRDRRAHGVVGDVGGLQR